MNNQFAEHDETLDFIFWCAGQVLELAGIGPQAEWASAESKRLRAYANSVWYSLPCDDASYSMTAAPPVARRRAP